MRGKQISVERSTGCNAALGGSKKDGRSVVVEDSCNKSNAKQDVVGGARRRRREQGRGRNREPGCFYVLQVEESESRLRTPLKVPLLSVERVWPLDCSARRE